jgi:hypothetical protein
MVSQPVRKAATAKPPAKIKFVLIFVRNSSAHFYSNKVAHGALICKGGDEGRGEREEG